MIYDLPKTLKIDDIDYEIRSDFRAILDIICALNDHDLTEQQKAIVMLQIMYIDYEKITNVEEALKKASWFIDCGKEYTRKEHKPTLMDWEQDFNYIIAPINKILGFESRSAEYLHWWSFIGAYQEIGECSFSNIVAIRSKKAKHKKLEQWEKEFYLENIDIIKIKPKTSEDLQKLIDEIV